MTDDYIDLANALDGAAWKLRAVIAAGRIEDESLRGEIESALSKIAAVSARTRKLSLIHQAEVEALSRLILRIARGQGEEGT